MNKITSTYKSAVNFREGLEPKFFSDRVEFAVTLKNLNYKTIKSEAKNEAKNEAKSEAKISELTGLERKLCKYLQRNPEVTQIDLIEKFDLSRSKVQRTIKILVDKGFLVREGSRRKGKWKVYID